MDIGIELLKSHTVLHISQQSLTLDSHLQSLISFLSFVQVKAAFDPPNGNGDLLTLCCPHRHVPVCHGSACQVVLRDRASYCRYHTVALQV